MTDGGASARPDDEETVVVPRPDDEQTLALTPRSSPPAAADPVWDEPVAADPDHPGPPAAAPADSADLNATTDYPLPAPAAAPILSSPPDPNWPAPTAPDPSWPPPAAPMAGHWAAPGADEWIPPTLSTETSGSRIPIPVAAAPARRQPPKPALLAAAGAAAAALLAVTAFWWPGFAHRTTLEVSAAEKGVTEVLTSPSGYAATNVTDVVCNDGKNPRVRSGGSFTCALNLNGTARHLKVTFADNDGTYWVGIPE